MSELYFGDSSDRELSLGGSALAVQRVGVLAVKNLQPSGLVEFWSDFESTVEVPFPSASTRRAVDDLAATLSGTKPATLLGGEGLEDPLVGALISAENDRYTTLKTASAIDFYGGEHFFVGREENVTELAVLFTERGESDHAFHIAVGKALGYPNEAISNFLVRIGKDTASDRADV